MDPMKSKVIFQAENLEMHQRLERAYRILYENYNLTTQCLPKLAIYQNDNMHHDTDIIIRPMNNEGEIHKLENKIHCPKGILYSATVREVRFTIDEFDYNIIAGNKVEERGSVAGQTGPPETIEDRLVKSVPRLLFWDNRNVVVGYDKTKYTFTF